MSILSVEDERLLGVAGPDPSMEMLADGFQFTEGALWHPLEAHLTFSDIPSSRIHRWSQVGGLSVLREPSSKANGLTYDRQGRLLMCEHASAQVTRLEVDGSITVLAGRYGGLRLNSPNDIVCAENGTIFFTDPTYGRDERMGSARAPEMDVRGVYRLPPNGELERIADDFIQPNGLCLSLDRTRLFVNDSEAVHIRVFEIDDDGRTRGGGLWVVTEENPPADNAPSGPDGMKIDSAGNIWCAGTGGVLVFAPDASRLGVLRTPQYPANFCFGGEGLRDLFLTAGTALYRTRINTSGLRVF